MFHSARHSFCTSVRGPLLAVAALLGVALCAAMPVSAQVVQTYSFADGTADGWTSFNGASTPAASSLVAFSPSTFSLLTTTGSGGQGGPSISVGSVLLAGATYTISGWIQLSSGESASNADFTVKRSDPSCTGGTCFDTIGAFETAVTAGSWVQIGGSYTVPATETGLVLYAQLVGASTAQSFYLGNVVITETAPPPGGTPIASYNFADGGVDGWKPFGSATLTNAAPPVLDPAGDALSLLVTNRTASFMGPSLNLLNVPNVVAGATYQVSAWVLLAAADSTNPTATLSTQTANCATSAAFANLGTSAPLSNTVWTQVTGTFTFSDLPGAPSSLILYIQSSSPTDSFYIDDVVIGELAPAPPTLSQQDNSGITTTFADGGVDGWSSRAGSTVSNAVPPVLDPNNDANALLTTGRTADYDGPQISVSNKMYVGSEYNISGWVLLTPADGSSHVINMSLQTTLDGNTSFPSVTAYPGVTVVADGKWHQISVTGYTMSSAYTQGAAFLYFQTVPPSGSDLVSFYLGDFQLSYVTPPVIQTNIPSIYKTFAGLFRVGGEVDTTDLSGPHAQLLTKHFDSMTPGNDLKWSVTEPSLGNYDYTNGDAEVGQAVCANMRVRGQNLLWSTGEQTPAYATGDGTNSAANQAVVTSNIQEHIQNEVQHYGSKVYAWDVVNEPIDSTQSDCLAHGPFYNVLGASYIDVAFKAAKQYAPPGTELFINDYSTTDPAKLACLVKVVRELRDRGVPVNAIGHEMHQQINFPTPASMTTAIDTVAQNFPNLDQQVTELDMSVYNAGDDTSNYGNNIPASVLAEQGWLYKAWFEVFRGARDKLSSVTFWGLADDDTWLDGFPVTRTDYPLPFDMELQAKPAYWGIVDPTHLPGFGLKFAVTSRMGARDARVWTVTATNGDVGPAYATQITGVTLTQIAGRRCTPVITSPTKFPVVLGDIATSASASTPITIDFASCQTDVHFKLAAPWTSATYETGVLETGADFHR
jgi:endo-1,4-beta-xylanase